MKTKESASVGERDYSLEEVRGFMTNRGIRPEVLADGMILGGVFDKMGLSASELWGKKILDVGTGGGRTVEESRGIGLDMVGVDIAPVISLRGKDKLGKRRMVEAVQTELKYVVRKYSGSIVGADATVVLPFGDDSFDVVFSHLGLPGYARNPKELAVSFLEMVMVAGERLIITGEDFKDGDVEGVREFGACGNDFKFAYRKFLDFIVSGYGIKYKVIPRTPLMASPSFDFDVTGKVLDKIKNEKTLIIEKAEELKR